MNINDILAQSGGLKSLARELGLSESQAASGAEALTPAILGGIKKQAQQPAGAEGLGGLLGRLGGGNLFDNVVSSEPTNVSQGNEVLGQIFGSKDVSRTVAQNASAQSGLDPGLLKKMLPMLAMLVTGYLAKQRSGGPGRPSEGGGGLGGLLGGLFGGQGGSANSPSGGGFGGLGSILGGGGNDDNPLDDILRQAGKV